MQRLTFHRYLERYVRSLSDRKTNSIFKLAHEVSENPRLTEPLFLYALGFGKINLLLRATIDKPIYTEYNNLANEYNWKDFLKLLERSDAILSNEYRKVYSSYLSRRDMYKTENDTRRLIHKKTRKLQEKKGISNYRIYTDLKLNQSNVNAYLKHGDISRVSKGTAKKMIDYLEAS